MLLKEENKRTEWPNDVHMKTESHIDLTDGPENLKLYTGHLVLASCHVENRQIRFCSCRGEVKKMPQQIRVDDENLFCQASPKNTKVEGF